MSCVAACSSHLEGVCGPSYSRIRIELHPFDGNNRAFVCRQCESPACLAACPTTSISRDSRSGVVTVDTESCTGCGSCVEACPFGAIHLHPDLGTAIKCELCGGSPRCVGACRFGVLSLG